MEVLAVLVTLGPRDWAEWRRFEAGWRFWMDLGSWGTVLAFVSLIGCLLLTVFRRSSAVEEPVSTRGYFWLNLLTIVLSIFVPAVAVRIG